jgi:O-antigen/teichoic acid export membrane protein
MTDDSNAHAGRRYLMSVLGFSSIPRLITSVLTLATFPLVVRAVGPSEYGVFVYATAMLNIVILLTDFGVAAAAGKGLAEARLRGPWAAREELVRCVRLQAVVGLVGLIPVLAISWVFVVLSKTMVIDPKFLITMVFGAWLAMASAFVRQCLQAYLAFGWLAVLDSTESILRTITWLAVVWLIPTSMGLALSTLLTSMVTSVLGLTILLSRARRPFGSNDSHEPASEPRGPYQRLVTDSVHFLGIGVATRLFQSAPFVLFGQVLGPDVVGVIGAFSKLLDMITFPFITIGNAIGVRAYEVKRAGLKSVVALWDACLRFEVIAAGAAGLFVLGSDIFATLLIPDSKSGAALFSILSALVLTHSAACFLTPMSDFVGGVKRRMIFVGALAFGQIPFLWIAVRLWRESGAVIGYVAMNAVMIAGYIIIAKGVFFGKERYSPPPYILKSFAAVGFALLISIAIKSNVEHTPRELFPYVGSFSALAAYLALICVAFMGIAALRKRFMTSSVFEFTRS